MTNLKDSGRQHGCIASVELSTANDNKGQPKGQAKGTIDQLLQTWVRLLDLRTCTGGLQNSQAVWAPERELTDAERAVMNV